MGQMFQKLSNTGGQQLGYANVNLQTANTPAGMMRMMAETSVPEPTQRHRSSSRREHRHRPSHQPHVPQRKHKRY